MTIFFCIFFDFMELYEILSCESRYFSYSLLSPLTKARAKFPLGQDSFS